MYPQMKLDSVRTVSCFAPKLEPFNGTNYSLWAFKMKMFLISKGLWEAVEATSGISETKEQQAHAAIVLNLSDTQLMHVITTGSAREAWGALAQVHDTRHGRSAMAKSEVRNIQVYITRHERSRTGVGTARVEHE